MNSIKFYALPILLLSMLFSQPDPYDGMCWELNDLTGQYSWVDCNGGGGFDIDISGCTDPLATNYNPMATIDDGNCYYFNPTCLQTECGQMLQAGFTCEQILNDEAFYNVDCTLCYEDCNITLIYGCTDSDATNYNPQANYDDGTCEYDENGCGSGLILDCSGDGDCCPEGWLGDNFCDDEDEPVGCDLTCYNNDGGDCEEAQEDVYGCTDETADNYNWEATIDDGTCLYNGCASGEVPDCNNPEVCVDAFYIGDGWCQDGSDSNYNFDVSCYDNDGGDCEEQVELDLALTLISPQGGDYIEDYTNVNVRWEYEGSDSLGITLSFNCSYYMGGGLVEVENNIDLRNGSAIVDLSTDINGNAIEAETIFANFKIIASDSTGASSDIECSDEFILGNPEGEINAHFMHEDQASVLLDWAWMEDQTIVITREAILDLQEQGYEFISIHDTDGVHTDDCDDHDTTGSVTLSTIDIRTGSMQEVHTQFLTLPCGFDYCYEDGDRIMGYLPDNQIHFSTGYFGQSEYEMMPASPQMLNNTMMFDNNTYIVDEFTIGLFLHNQTISTVDDRDWDRFNVYGKVTNHQGSTTRTCNDDGVCDPDESLVDCFDDCCLVPGTGENADWCFVENIDGISNFEDNLSNGNYLPAGTSSATLNYRVWLLNDADVEVVKTIDTEIDYQADVLFCEGIGDVNGDGSVNVTDVISLIGHILETALITDPILLCEADLNGDELYNINDIVALVGIILN